MNSKVIAQEIVFDFETDREEIKARRYGIEVHQQTDINAILLKTPEINRGEQRRVLIGQIATIINPNEGAEEEKAIDFGIRKRHGTSNLIIQCYEIEYVSDNGYPQEYWIVAVDYDKVYKVDMIIQIKEMLAEVFDNPSPSVTNKYTNMIVKIVKSYKRREMSTSEMEYHRVIGLFEVKYEKTIAANLTKLYKN